MWKPLVVLAVVANTILITTTKETHHGSYPDKTGNHHRKCPGSNEVYDQCPVLCPARECGVDNTLILCAPAPKPGSRDCKPGCRCADGFLRNKAGICIPEDECPLDCAKNETLDPCLSDCPPRFCGVNIAAISCLAIPERDCEPGCRCSDGFLRNVEGFCVLEDECPQSCGNNEILSNCSNGGCGPWTCSDIGFPTGCVKMDQKYCKVGCICKDGYVRENGICIPITDCQKCSANERWEECPARLCSPQSCKDLGFDKACDTEENSPCPGPPGCVCDYDFVRDDSGKCIPKKECPSCGGDANAQAGCGLNCGRLCSNYDKGPAACPRICRPNSCDCKKDFMFDVNIKKCVRPKDCTPVCRDHEVYSECTNGGCSARNCSQLGKPVSCVELDTKSCLKGCICEEGYLRARNGTCVPEEKCDNCNKPHEYYDSCAPSCPPQTCESIGRQDPCPITATVCRGSCRCEKGYFRNKIGECICKTNCLKCRGPHEYFSCGGACDNVCATLHKQNQTNCPIKNIKCNPMCYCEVGYARDKNNVCIPIDKCPTQCTEANEIYDLCPAPCPPRRCDVDERVIRCAAPPKPGDPECEPGCRCADGFVRNAAGKCVTRDQCPPSCGNNEILSNCSNGGCGPWTCSDVGFPTGCVKMDQKYCKVGCICKDGYVRENGICIPVTECRKCGANERYEECPARLCSPQSCKDLGFDKACDTEGNSPCPGPPGCVCDYNFVRDDSGKCIPKQKCPSCGGDANAQAGCGLNCGRLCSNYDKGPAPCPRICRPNSCDCKKDFVFDVNIKKCVRPKDCTPVCRDHEVYSECTNGGCSARNCSQLGKPVPCVKFDSKSCLKGCICEEGYLRARNGTCVPKEKCDNCNKPHEYYDSCAPSCPPQTCESIGRQDPCPITATVCRGSCRCDKGYFRNKIGECISKKNCLKCRGPHEYFSCGGACDNVCATLHKQNQTNCPIINIKCNPMCYCEKGYARDKNNVCIPINKCPTQCTGANEIYDLCPAPCPPRRCDVDERVIRCAAPPKPGDPECEPGCRCADGFVRNAAGKCVTRDQCPPSCGKNEILSNCSNGGCGPWTCSDVGFPTGCVKMDQKYCKVGCICKDGYVRENGICIPVTECLKCRGPHEYFSCGGACDNVCATLHKQNQTNCPIINIKCNPMCYCEKGYARDKNNVCIPIDKCPKPRCGVNERLEQCPPGLCTPQKCSQLGFPIACPDLPEYGCPEPPGCVCIDNYVRDATGRCIPKQNCPSCGGDIYAVSGCGVNCGRTCSLYNRTDIACPAVCYFNACDCRKGYVLDGNINKCVRPKDCTPTCRKNEIYDTCANGGCGKWNCEQLGQPDICIDVIKCIGGCVCQKGFLRAKNGTCVPQNQCPIPPCGKNERFVQCPNALCEPQTCSQLGFPVACPAPSADSDCPGQPACICDYGFVRNNKGICIPINQCPSCGGDPNAELGCDNCGRHCSNYNKGPVPCPKVLCRYNSCSCKKGYVFDDNTKKCVRPKDCTPICKEDEVFSECTNGGCEAKNCSQLGKQVPCVKIDPKYCIKGCLCKEGYLRESNGVCVPKEKCAPQKCGKNERLDDCPDWLCSPKSCSQVGFPIACPAFAGNSTGSCPGRPGCVCIDNYVRDDNGKCIPIKECPSCGGDSKAVSGCGVNCGRLCSNYKKKNVVCPFICELNGCDCRQGFVYDSNIKKCVHPKDCSPVCRTNEVYDLCANGGCQKRNCSQVEQPMLCIDPIKCIAGCVCQEGFLRNKNGTCVPQDQCPLKCPKPHEYYDPCPRSCPPQTCDSIGKAYPCPNPPEGDEYCNAACRCEEGYYRNSVGECISEKECLRCTGPNEHYSCGGACDNVCATLSKQNQTNCPIVNIKCNPKCYCDEGYARDDNDICIPIEQCGVKCTKPHEVYDPCPRSCPPQTCDSIGKLYPCARPLEGDEYCNAACRCEEGYYRNSVGECISEKDCLRCTGPNEHYSCGGACDNVCATLSKQNQTNCPIVNKKCNPKCYCDEGYARDDNDICIPIEQCGVSCHEDPNAIPGCGDYCGNSCSDYNKGVIACPLLCILDSCDCKESYVYDDNLKKCVQPKDCSYTKCDRPHEVYSSCPSMCPPQTCESLDRAYICPIEWGQERPCQPGCICEQGYFRNKIGDCISEENCLKCNKPHEFYSCGGACDNVCATLNEQNQTNCPIVNIKCNEMCYCEEGYARNDSNICIAIEDCPPPRCGPKERYEEHPSQICEPLFCSEVSAPMDCPPREDPDCEDTPACICKPGLVRNGDDGECIPICECPSTDTSVNATEARSRLDKGGIILAGKILYHLVSTKPDENSVASGTSLLTPLAQLLLWATGSVLEELLNVLNIKSKDEMKSNFPEYTEEFENQENVVFELATKYYANEGYPLSQNFKRDSKEYFHAEGENVNFSQNVATAKIINDWVSNRTHGKIQDLVNPTMFNADTRLCLVNAIYFLGDWLHQFNPNDTKIKNFTKSNGETVPLKMMYQQNTFNYAENDQFQVVEMPYKGNRFSFVMVLPKSNTSLLPTVKTLQYFDEYTNMIQSLKREQVQVTVPKMLIKTQTDIKELLKKLNAGTMFDPSSNGFKGLLETEESVYVTDAVQKAYISVDETGTEAAAANAITVGTTSAIHPPPKIYKFLANRPFAFYILFGSEQKVPVFCGSFVGAQ